MKNEITSRAYFTARAMQSILASPDLLLAAHKDNRSIEKIAVDMADKLIEALED